MSADNGIYILKDDDGYRVIHAQAIENIYWHPDFHGFNLESVKAYFGNAQIFATEDSAIDEAIAFEKEYAEAGLWTEYGICTLDSFPGRIALIKDGMYQYHNESGPRMCKCILRDFNDQIVEEFQIEINRQHGKILIEVDDNALTELEYGDQLEIELSE